MLQLNNTNFVTIRKKITGYILIYPFEVFFIISYDILYNIYIKSKTMHVKNNLLQSQKKIDSCRIWNKEHFVYSILLKGVLHKNLKFEKQLNI